MKIGMFGMGMNLLGTAQGVIDLSRDLEAHGYESVWIGEHPVLMDPREPPSPIDPETPIIDAVTALAAVAGATNRIRLATGVLILPLHEPLLLAKRLASIDVLSGGRLMAGVGVGYIPKEFEVIGIDFKTRGRRADDMIDVMRAMWTQDHPAHQGPFYSFSGIQAYPRPIQRQGIPIIVGSRSVAAHRRTVERGDGWYGFYLDLEETATNLEEIRHAEQEFGRPAHLGRLEISVTPRPGIIDIDTLKRYEDLGVDRMVLNPLGFRASDGLDGAESYEDVIGVLRRTADLLAPWMESGA